MARPIEDPQPEAPPTHRFIPEALYQVVLSVFEESTLPWPGAKVADTINALRGCQPTHAEPFPRAVE